MNKNVKNSDSLETPKQKRDRSVNFTQEETEVLVSLAVTKTHIIENKKSDSATWQDKEKAWKEIEIAFNNRLGTVVRDHKSLKLKYEGLKSSTRKKLALLNKSDGATGSCPPLTPIEQKIRQMIMFSADGNDSNDSDYVLPSASTLEPLITWAHSEEHSVPSMEQRYEQDDISRNFTVEIDEELSEPPKKRVCEEPREESKPRGNRPFVKLIKKKIELAQLQKEIMTEELEQKFIQRQILEQELEHKNIVHDLEKQHLLLKIELLKKGFDKI